MNEKHGPVLHLCYNITDSSEPYNNITSHINCTVLNETDLTNSTRPFVLPFWEKLSWTLLFSLTVLAAVSGNILVIWVVLAHRRMRTITNYFLLSLSVADLMMATFNIIFNFIFVIDSHWPFGLFYCKINNFVANLTVSTSVLSIMAISIDRYVATLNTMRPRLTKCSAGSIIFIIWLSGCLLSLPQLIFSTTQHFNYDDGTRTVCMIMWPDGPEWSSAYDYVYNIIFMHVTYIVPVVSMAVTYGIIAKELWGTQHLGGSSHRHQEILNSKKKVIRMFIVMVFTFALCWLPYHVLFIYRNHDQSILHTTYIQHVFLGFYWLAMSNSMFNPFIYYWMNARFRDYFRTALCCISCRIKRIEYPCSPQGEKRFSGGDAIKHRSCETPQRALMCVYSNSDSSQRYRNCYQNENECSPNQNFAQNFM